MSPLALPCLAALCAGAATTSPAAATPAVTQPPSYVVRGAGNATADGVYVQRSKGSGASYVAASGMQLFRFQGRWYIVRQPAREVAGMGGGVGGTATRGGMGGGSLMGGGPRAAAVGAGVHSRAAACQRAGAH